MYLFIPTHSHTLYKYTVLVTLFSSLRDAFFV